MRQLLHLTILGVALAGAAACTHVQAAVPAPVPLDVPDGPPRVVVPPSTDILADPEPSTAPTTPATVAPARPATTTPVRQPEKPPASPPASAAPPQQETSTPPNLETTSDTSSLKIQTQQIIGKAYVDLNRVDPNALSQEARAQYERARSFVRQAENALKEGNLTYAHTMAEKAAALAGQLPKTKPGVTASAV